VLTLVLLPGMDGTGALFAPLVAALPPSLKVAVVRYPVSGSAGYAELEAVARASLPASGDFIILGESFSGPIAVSLAASCGPRLKGLVLCCSFVRNPRPLLGALGPLVRWLPVGLAPPAALADALMGRFSTPGLRNLLKASLRGVSPTALRARLAAVLSVDVSAKLAMVTVPTLYLRATEDSLVPRAAGDLVAQLNPGCRIVDIAAPHFLLQAAPSQAAEAIGMFAKEVHNAR
jgi:pimeloyl-[acyl-carrier protein] methyl ester esterase